MRAPPTQKDHPKLAASVDLAEKGVSIGFDTDPAKVKAYIGGLSMDERLMVIHRDPSLTTAANAFYVVAIYENKRDRPLYAVYGTLRLSPRRAQFTTPLKRPLLPGQRMAFVWLVQKPLTPQVAHFSFSETASPDQVGQSIVQHVPKQFLVGAHSRNLSAVGGGVRQESGVIHADSQPDHFERPMSTHQFVEATNPSLAARLASAATSKRAR